MNTLHRIASFRFALILSVLVAPLPASVGQAGAALAQALPEESAVLPEGIEVTGDTAEVRALIAWLEEHQHNHPVQVRQVAERALALARDLDDQRGIGWSLMVLGYVASAPYQAETYFMEAQEIFERIGDDKLLIRNYINLGNANKNRGALEEALGYYFDALKGFERLDDVEGQSRVLNNIGNTHYSQENLEEAQTYYERAVTLAQTLSKPVLLANNLNGLAYVLAEQGSYERAEATLREALAIAEEQGHQRYTAMVSNNLGEVLNKQGLYRQALPFLFTAERVSKELEETRFLTAVYDQFAKTHLGLGEYDSALRFAHESLTLAQETGSMPQQMEAHQTLSQIYEETGDTRRTLAHYREYAATRDSVFTAEKAKIVTEMQTRYETEEKQRAIERLEQENQIQALRAGRRQTLLLGGLGGLLLILGFLFSRYRLKQKANRLLARQKEEILQQKKEKEILLQEIHHRVKNNLQVIAGLLGIQAKAAHDPEALTTLREAQGRVQAITLLHQKLYREESLTRVDMQEYMEDLAAYLARTFDADGVAYRVQANNIRLDVDTAIPLGLITNELVTNAFEHAFPGKGDGEVCVRLHEKGGNGYELEVSDNGIGFPTERSRREEAIGMKLVESLTRQLHGQLDIENGQGVTFRIRFERTEGTP